LNLSFRSTFVPINWRYAPNGEVFSQVQLNFNIKDSLLIFWEEEKTVNVVLAITS